MMEVYGVRKGIFVGEAVSESIEIAFRRTGWIPNTLSGPLSTAKRDS